MEEEYYSSIVDSAQEVTPEKLVEIIFSKPPQKPFSIGLLPQSLDEDHESISGIFEVLVDIYTNAVIDGKRLYEILMTNKSIKKTTEDKIDVYNILKEHLEIPEKWFRSFGYTIEVSEYTTEEFDQLHSRKLIPHLYYKLLLRDNPNDSNYFVMKNINRPYHYVKNIDYIEAVNISDMSMLIVRPKKPTDPEDKGRCFIISFGNYKIN